MFLLGFRRKLTALALCKSIDSAIQWFQIHHRITFATIQNPAVYLSGARVSIFSTLVPRLYGPNNHDVNFFEQLEKDQGQSSSTPDPGYQWEIDNFSIRHHKPKPRGQPFPSR